MSLPWRCRNCAGCFSDASALLRHLFWAHAKGTVHMVYTEPPEAPRPKLWTARDYWEAALGLYIGQVYEHPLTTGFLTAAALYGLLKCLKGLLT